MRSLSLIFLAVFGFAVTASAAPSRGPVPELVEETKLLLGSARSYLSAVKTNYDSTAKGIETAQAAQKKRLFQQVEDQRAARRLLDSSLQTAIEELFTTDAQLAIIPSIAEFSETLVEMTDYYREQSGFPQGEETLDCGPSCSYYQKRRDALSAMIDLLRDELIATGEIVRRRREVVQALAQDLGHIQNHPDSALLRFGFDHWIELRTRLLKSQALIVEDIHQLATNTTFAGKAQQVPEPCTGGVVRYPGFLNDLEELYGETEDFESASEDPRLLYSVGHWIQGTKESPGPLKLSRDPYIGWSDGEGIYHPGFLDEWGGCSNTKSNVLLD